MFDIRTVQTFLDRVVDADAEHTVLVSEASVAELADRWQAAHIRPGDVVLLCLPNGKALLQHFFAVMMAGGVPTIVGPHTPSARLREVADAFGARAIASFRPLPSNVFGVPIATIGGAHVHCCGRDNDPAAEPGEVVLMTSGTSGFSSGCLFDFGALLLNADRHANAIGQSESDTVLINLPLHFSFALVAQALASLVRGNRLVISGPPFHCPSYFRTLADHRVTVSSLTPILARSLIDSVNWPDGLRVLSIGGDCLAPEQVEQLLAARPRGELYLTYGLTQAGPRVSTLAAHAEPPYRYSSVGRVHPGVTVELRDLDDGSDMKQLFIQSATVMKRRIGLLEGRGQSAAMADSFIGTGDVFEQDADGYLYFKGRISDYIVRKGEKVCLAAIRRVAMRCPDVIRARTVVTKHEYGDDFELVLHVAERAEDNSAQALRSWLRKSEMPRAIRVVRGEEAQASAYK
ncbi:MAG: class I adenylate-forming enzyme family protein [Tepidisphaeraceae bacterium]|jgi:acyl-CoA synthetase (AMP-forming)/AMP-acid ligase II